MSRDLAQRIHDELAEDYPALCDPSADHPHADDDPAYDTVMKAHDISVAHGAECDGMGGEKMDGVERFSDDERLAVGHRDRVAMFKGGGAKAASKASAKPTDHDTSTKPSKGKPSGHASSSGKVGGCGNSAGGFTKGNTCGHKGNRNAKVEEARAAHTQAKNDVLTHVKAHRAAVKSSAKSGESAPHPKELHAAIRKAAVAHGQLVAARATHKAEQRGRRNAAAKERRAIASGKAHPLSAKPKPVEPTKPAHVRSSQDFRSPKTGEIDPSLMPSSMRGHYEAMQRHFDAGEKGRARSHRNAYDKHLEEYIKGGDQPARHTGLTSSQSSPSRTDRQSRNDRVAVAAARHRQIAKALRRRAMELHRKASEDQPINHQATHKVGHHNGGIGGRGRSSSVGALQHAIQPERSPEAVTHRLQASALKRRADAHESRATKLEGLDKPGALGPAKAREAEMLARQQASRAAAHAGVDAGGHSGKQATIDHLRGTVGKAREVDPVKPAEVARVSTPQKSTKDIIREAKKAARAQDKAMVADIHNTSKTESGRQHLANSQDRAKQLGGAEPHTLSRDEFARRYGGAEKPGPRRDEAIAEHDAWIKQAKHHGRMAP